MYLTASSSVWRRYLAAVFVCTMVQCLPAYAAGSDKVLKIDPRDVTGIQYMPEEIASMMEELGYEWMPVHDHAVGHGIEVAQQNGQYRMKFRASDAAAVTIDVHIRISDNVTGFYYHDAGDDAQDESSQSRFQKLRERMTLEFGADNVSEGHSFFTP
jgi:ABC-type transport system substrate-binding protein